MNNYSISALNYCCTMPLPGSGVGNITNAPLFVDPVAGDYRLRPDSPCINAGNNTYVVGSTDLDGNPRILGGTVDMGAHEFVPAAQVVQWLIELASESGLRPQRPLLAKLEAVLASIERGNSIAAINQLRGFQNKVGAQEIIDVLSGGEVSPGS